MYNDISLKMETVLVSALHWLHECRETYWCENELKERAVEPRNTACQGINKLYPMKVDRQAVKPAYLTILKTCEYIF